LKFEAFSQGEAKYLEVYKQQTIYSIYKYVWPEAQCCERHLILLWTTELSVVFCLSRTVHSSARLRCFSAGSSHLLRRWSEDRLYCNI